MAMLRTAGLFATSMTVASSFEFVSQTFDGSVTVKSDIPGVPSPPAPTLGTAYMAMDMERVNFRTDSHIVMDIHAAPGIDVHTDAKVSKIFDLSTKRYTAFSTTSTNTSSKYVPPSTHTVCEYFEFPGLKEAAAVQKCLADVASLAKPLEPEGGLQKFELSMPVPAGQGITGAMNEVVYTDSSFVVKKLIVDTDVDVNTTHIKTHSELLDMNSKAGAPDTSVFAIPAEWGTCGPSAIPFDPSKLTGPIKAFLHCVGTLAASEHTVIV